MEALKVLKRIAYYLLFIVASTLFYREVISFALFPYTDAWATFSFDLLFKNVYLPFLYAVLSLAIAIIAQAVLINKPKEVETSIYPWTLMVYFGIGLIVAVFILVYGLLKMGGETVNNNPWFLVIPMIIAILFTLAEVLWGFLYFLGNKKKEKAKEAIKVQEEKVAAQVSLYKDEDDK